MTREDLVSADAGIDDQDDDDDVPAAPVYGAVPRTVQFAVTLPSGAVLPVLTEEEQRYLTERVRKYDEQIKFTNVSDLQDLDRIVSWELLIHRWTNYLTHGQDYQGNPIEDSVSLSRDLDKKEQGLRQLKKMVGLDKVSRDKQRGEGSLHLYVQNLLERAKAFGINRETQLDKALELINELIGNVTAYRNATESERKELGVTEKEILEWIWNVMRPEYEAVDEHFRTHVQSLFIREM